MTGHTPRGTPVTADLAIAGPLARAELRGLCAGACALLQRTAGPVVVCDVSEAAVDAVTVDALARLSVAIGAQGRRLVLAGAPPELRELIAFMGLEHVLRTRRP